VKRRWTPEELEEHWSLLPAERTLLANKAGPTRLGFAVMLKGFQLEGQFPQPQTLPALVIAHIAKQVSVPADLFLKYEWSARSARYHRAEIREFAGFRESTDADAQALADWVQRTLAPEDHRMEHLRDAVLERCRQLRVEPPSPGRVERLIRSGLHAFETQFFAETLQRLPPSTRSHLDRLLAREDEEAPDGSDATGTPSWWVKLRQDPGPVGIKSARAEIDKLQALRGIGLPGDLFAGVARRVLDSYRQRATAERPVELRSHPEATGYTVVAAFCKLRAEEVTDNLVELLIHIIHKIGARAEKKVVTDLLEDFQQVTGKTGMLYRLAEAAIDNPDGVVREVLFPVVGEQTLKDLVREHKSTGSAYRTHVHIRMRASYGRHYRQILPKLLAALEFASSNEVYRPVILGLEQLKRYADSSSRFYGADEDVPLNGVVTGDWWDLVVKEDARGRLRVERIAYEVCLLEALRDKLRCKEIWVAGAHRWRNPDEDLPQDFEANREGYYRLLCQPREAETFVGELRRRMTDALETLDRGMPKNRDVRILDRGNGWISLSPLKAQPEPPNIIRLKAELARRWPMISLLDMAKETDLRVPFTPLFRSVLSRENLDRLTLQKRILLCVYALGTNTGIKRMAAGDHGETYDDLRYARRRFMQTDSCRAAIAEVVNGIFAARRVEIWGEGTTACASDSKKFGAWDQNLMTEWHVRYGGPGIMIYWHVDKKAACIYSQLKRCSSSEAAAMIEGVLRHCTDMVVERAYVDSHGQSAVAFGFCHLLGFRLLPRLKAIHLQKLYRPQAGQPAAYHNLQPVLTRPINWELIVQEYDQMVKFATALRVGTAETETILRRFTRSNVKHPTYQALAETGNAERTVFLCEYLHLPPLRREVEEGLNVVENWNGTNDFIHFGRGGEFASNRLEDQELGALALHLLQSCLVYINTLMIQRILAEPEWRSALTPEDLRALTPLMFAHVTPYGRFRLDMNERLQIELDDGLV